MASCEQPSVPGGSALNGLNPTLAFWEDTTATNTPQNRVFFSWNTCNGCHGRETNVKNFVHVARREPGSASALNSFLVGCDSQNQSCLAESQDSCTLETLEPNGNCPGTESVTDPTGTGSPTSFGDIERRITYLQTVCSDAACDGGTGNDLLLPFANKPIGVH